MAQHPPLEAGFATVDITPPPDPAGSFRILDRIFLRALFLKQASQSCTFLAADLFAIDHEFEAGIRDLLQNSGIDVQWILPGAAHLGTGPTFFSSYVNQPTESLKEYERKPFYIGQAAACIRAACDSRRPARVAIGTGHIEGLSYNRRAHDDAGQLHMVSLTAYPSPPASLHYDRVDSQVGVIRVDSCDDNRQIALFVFGCHALARWDDRGNISGDWPGETVRLLAAGGIDALFFQGALGNVHPVRRGRAPARRIGHGIAGVVLSVFHTLDPGDQFPLRRAECTIEVPVRPQPAVEAMRAAWSQAPLHQEGLERYRYYLAQRYEGVRATLMRIRAVAIGDATIIHIPAELFAETALELRRRCQSGRLILLCGPAPENGYVPTAAAHVEGGDEPQFAPLDVSAEQLIVTAACKLVAQLQNGS